MKNTDETILTARRPARFIFMGLLLGSSSLMFACMPVKGDKDSSAVLVQADTAGTAAADKVGKEDEGDLPISSYTVARPMIVMPLGASITQGVGSKKSGYRNVVDDLLTKAKIEHRFVGSSIAQAGTMQEKTIHHEGHPGFVITAGTSGRSGITDNITKWLGPNGPYPDYILLLLGSNDVDLNYKLNEAGARMDKLITIISNKKTGLRPKAHLIVSTLPLVNDAAGEARSKVYNDAIMAVAAKHKANGENVSTIDAHAVITPSDKYDNLHPNDNGYNKIGNVWFKAITGK